MDGNSTPQNNSDAPQPLQPGATISPAASPAAPAAPVIAAAPPVAEAPVAQQPAPVTPAAVTPPPVAEPAQPEPPLPVQSVAPAAPAPAEAESQAQNQYASQPNFDPAAPETDAPMGSSQGVGWTASEFIAHNKTPGWYALLFVVAVVVAAIVWFITKDLISSAVVVLALAVLAGYASRQPRELQYIVDEHGIAIGNKHYTYDTFRSFSVIPEGAFASIELIPAKRFMPAITVYYAPDDEEAIVEAISQHLPFERRQRDFIDQLMRRIRF